MSDIVERLRGAGIVSQEEAAAEIERLRAQVERANTSAQETWAYIERLLVEECGLRPDEGLSAERANFINAIRNGRADGTLLVAAAEMLRKESIVRIRVNGELLSREEVASALSLSSTTEHGGDPT